MAWYKVDLVKLMLKCKDLYYKDIQEQKVKQ